MVITNQNILSLSLYGIVNESIDSVFSSHRVYIITSVTLLSKLYMRRKGASASSRNGAFGSIAQEKSRDMKQVTFKNPPQPKG